MNEQLMPIDIQCNKLVDWLIDRRHCSIRWQTAAQVVKSKISAALLDMPSTEEMQKLIEGSCFHYFKCLEIVDVLKDTEKDSKNIFGMYSSKRMKDWREIVKLYEKENLHIAELSSRLIRNVNYEIPALKRQISKCKQVQEECKKKIQECDRSIQLIEKRYADECKKVGITGQNMKKELMELVRELPSDFSTIGQECKKILPVIEFYSAFVEFILSSDQFSKDITPLLKHVCLHGNSTIYQWKHGEVPDKVLKENPVFIETETVALDEGGIDWGSGAPGAFSSDVIDFNIDVSDLGIVLEGSGDNENKNNDNGYEIIAVKDENWQIEEVSITEIPNGSKIITSEKVARGDEALTILEFLDTRTQFINELIELSAFLSQRLVESRRETDVLSLNQFQSAPPILQLTSTTELESMLAQVSSVQGSITTSKMQKLCKILDSPKYVDRLTDDLKRQLNLTGKYQKLQASYQNAIKNSQMEEVTLYPKVDFLIKETKEWQKLIQAEISKRYKDRPVYILGSINLL